MDAFRLHRGTAPLLLSIPHVGTAVPEPIRQRLVPEARPLPDTDWHLDQLYDFAEELGVSVLQAVQSRYVIDLNRPPDDESLYPGQATTGLCPTIRFDGVKLYWPGAEPDAADIAERVETVWKPYHAALAAELERIEARHGYALLYDAHSIRSVVPRLFDGVLPDLNLGSNGGASAAPALKDRIAEICRTAEGFTHVVDGRFRGGYITRHYGRPERNVHALQMELAQRHYMDEDPPFAYRPDVAPPLKAVLRRVLESMLAWTP
ncbi:N-formylglutamate deformylase [Inquilinus sp. NPDC058860]|uniref:N-formylglutamate deformylase n=1 Tax=Inquilinus sp. NPDC058860 TaxID=3346652 RepID=UPI003685E851